EPFHYLKLSKIISAPRLSAHEKDGGVSLVLPYIRQKSTVIRDIFQTLSQFPIAFPLVIPELNEASKFRVMFPLFTGPVIKWETKPGTIIENYLFNSPFRMIVTIRIGTNTLGKSTILNLLMSSNSMFSSSGEPGAEYGALHMTNGSIEFTWLIQETCGTVLWKDVFEKFYRDKEKNEIALLANLHGDALNYQIKLNF
ncbi:21064_t:CDS:2, partial [Gigaspora margarita]